MFRLFAVSAVVTLFFLNCSDDNRITASGTDETSVASIKITMAQDSPFRCLADSAVITVSAGDMLTITRELTVTDSSVEGSIEGIPVGKARFFSLAVYDSMGNVQYRGTAEADIAEGSTARITLTVIRVSGDAEITAKILERDTGTILTEVEGTPLTGETGSFVDDFTGTTLDQAWSILRNDTAHWVINDGSESMDVVSQTGEFNHPADVPPRNLFLVTLPGMFTLLETKLTFAPTADFQQAGLLVYGNDTTYLKFDRLYASNAPVSTGNQVVEYVGSPALDNFRAWYRATETTLILRLVREGSSVIAQFSTDEAYSFTAVDTLPDIAALENARAGIFTMNGARSPGEIKAVFDYFKVEW